ncbi:unnamed protein product [Phytomonas sp. EM1]|nr:unnamed protein product [Phytomonas sp. EM1]|eukprot:CCW64600.1 unnamed protein product [Phytomonas sp. isolate EM1]
MSDANVFGKWPTLEPNSGGNTYKVTATSTYIAYFNQWLKASNNSNKACEQRIHDGTNARQESTTVGDAMDDVEDVERDRQVCQLNFALSAMGPSFTETTVASIWDEAMHEEVTNRKVETKPWEMAVLRCVEWLCHGVHSANGIKLNFLSQGLVQHALGHVVLHEPPASQVVVDDKGVATNSSWMSSFPSSFTALEQRRQKVGTFCPALVLLLFHRHIEVRIRAREALLACVDHASTVAPVSLNPYTSCKPHGAVSLPLESSLVPTHAVMSELSPDTRPKLDVNRHNSGRARASSPLEHPSQKLLDSKCMERTLIEHRLQRLWRLSLELLCALKHLTQVRFLLLQGNLHVSSLPPHEISPHSAEITRIMTEGIYHLFVVLTALDQRITKITSDRSTLLRETTSNHLPQLPHPVTVLLLGGSMSLEWLFNAHEDLVKGVFSSFSSSLLQCIAGYDNEIREEEVSRLVHFRAMQELIEGLNNGLRHDRTLEPASLTIQVKKSIAKVIIHVLLEYAREPRASSTMSVSPSVCKEELDWRVKRLNSCWWLAGALDSPSTTNFGTVDEFGATFSGGAVLETATTTSQRTCLYWLLGPLLKNAHIQWRVDEVVAEARTHPTIATHISSNKDRSTQSTMLECTLHSYYFLFHSLIKAMPDVVASNFFHSILEKHEQAVNALAVGGVLRHGSSHAIYLFEFLLQADLLAFSDSGHIWLWDEQAVSRLPALKRVLSDVCTSATKVTMKNKPLSCLQRAWTNYPAVLKQVLRGDRLKSFPHVLEQLVGVLHVFVNIPMSVAQCSQWLLLLPDDPNWPQPLGWALKNFIAQLLEFFEMHGRGIREKWAAGDPSAALSRLLTSGLDIPRLVCRLQYAQSSQLRHLAELLNTIFLDNLGPTARLTFASDAAQWMWQDVLLHQEALMGFVHSETWLQLHNARVDNLARQQGRQWLRVLRACNWCSMRTENRDCSPSCSPTFFWCRTVASAWWMASLLADVVTLDTDERVTLLKQVIMELPQPPFLHLPRDAVKLYEIVRHLFLCLIEKHAAYSQDTLLSALLHVSSVLPNGKAEADTQLSNAAKRPMVALLDRYLLKESRQTLDQYAPKWLTRIIKSATCVIDACQNEERRSFKQFEWQEKQIAIISEAKTEQVANDSKVRQQLERMRVEEINTASALTLSKDKSTNSYAQYIVAGRKRPRKPPWMEDDSGYDSSSSSVVSVEGPTVLPCSLPMGDTRSLLVAFNPTENPAKVLSDRTSSTRTVVAEQTTRQRKLQAMNNYEGQKVRFNEYEKEIMNAMRGIVGRTSILNRHPRVNDIIGQATHCLAANVPTLPEVYMPSTEATDKDDSSNSGTYSLSRAAHHHVNHRAAWSYVRSFVPHVALEVRCGIVADVNKLMDAASKKGYVWTTKSGTHRSQNCGAHSLKGCDPKYEVRANTEKGLSQYLLKRFPLSKWVDEEAVRALRIGSIESDPLDPGKINFTVIIKDNLSSPSIRQFGDDDIVLVLLPLTVVLDAWLRWRARRRTGRGAEVTEDESCIKDADEVLNCIPEIWRIFGCFPQVCYVHLARQKERMLTLACYPQQTTAGATQQGLYGNTLSAGRGRECQSITRTGESPPSVANLLPFVHALRLGIRPSTDTLYIRWVSSMNPTIAAVSSLFRISRTHFSPMLYDPRGTSVVSRDYHDLMEKYFSEPDVMNDIQSRLLMPRLLNECQAKAVAAALHAVHPLWCGKSLLGVDAGGDKHTVDAASGISQNRDRRSVPAPEIHIIEGPPGTGKTQTLSMLILNFLHYLPLNSRILLCGPSNSAVDEALLRVLSLQKLLCGDKFSGLPPDKTTFAAQAQLLRIGIRQNISEYVLRHRPFLFLDDKLTQISAGCPSEETLSKEACSSRRDPLNRKDSSRDEIIKDSNVIFTTLGSIHQLLRLNIRFDVVIVDEVSQATEPSILPALMSAKGMCILVGDWKQLQPTVLHPESARCGLQRSLLERLLRNGYSSHLLCTQYRMHPDICAFPNRYFYANKLRTDSSVLQRQSEGCSSSHREAGEHGDSLTTPQQSLPWDKKTVAQKLGSIARLAFIDVPDGVMQRGRGNSWRNTCEAVAVVQSMRQIRNYLRLTIGEFPQHVGIITYYIAQRDAIQEVLTIEERRSGIQIATVDSFQGKEKDIILISCVRADTDPNAFRKGSRGKPTSESETAPMGAASEFESPADVYPGVFSGGIGFLNSWHRIDVSLTRARELCIVFGHRATLEAATRNNMKTTEDSAAPCAVGAAEHREAGVMVSNSPTSEATENLMKMDKDPSVLSKFIQHVVQHDISPVSKARGKSGSACERVSRKNSPICTSLDSSVEQKKGDEARRAENGASTCQAAYITYHKKMLLMQCLQK